MNKLEEKSEKIWDKWRKGEKTYEETIKELYKLFPEPKPVEKNLREEICEIVNNRMSLERRPQNKEVYFTKRGEIEKKVINELLKKKQPEIEQANREQENLLEKARVTGSICPHCGSENVRSYGKAEWKCYTCGKRFRKH